MTNFNPPLAPPRAIYFSLIMQPVLLTGFVKYNKVLSHVVMPRITRLPCPLSDTSNTIGTQDCRTNRQIFQRLDLLSRIKSFHGSGSTFTKTQLMELRRQGIFDFSLIIICSISTAPRLFSMYIHSYNNNSALDRFINCFKLTKKFLFK